MFYCTRCIYNQQTLQTIDSVINEQVKGTHCLGSDELVFKKRLKPFVMKCIGLYGWKDVLKVEYNGSHIFASKLRGFSFTA